MQVRRRERRFLSVRVYLASSCRDELRQNDALCKLITANIEHWLKIVRLRWIVRARNRIFRREIKWPFLDDNMFMKEKYLWMKKIDTV